MRFRHLSSAVIYNSVNLPPENLNILANYTLTQGQDTVITAAATDPEGDAITWSFEEVKSGTSYVAVPALFDDDNGTSSGSVYVYDANDLSAQPTKLTAFDGTAGDLFGSSVTFSADKIIVGAEQDDDNGTNSGSVYVYDANDLSAQPTKLTAFDGTAGDFFGSSVAVAADKIFVGASATDQDGNNSGSVYVYDLNDLSATPTELTAFDGAALDFFGYSISTTADKVIVGAYGDESNSGAIYVYDANDLSAQPTKLTAFDGAAADFFGFRISTAADKIVVSAFGDDDNGSNSGSVYVYDANDLSAQPTKLTAFDGAADDNFGYSVATSADKIIVGAHQDDENATNSGSVYVYDANDLSAQPTKLTAFDPIDYHVFGQSVAATDDKIFVGAGQDDDKGSNAGAVYVYDANDLSAQPTKLTAYDGAASDFFGMEISAVSAPSSLNGVTVSQSDNVFTITPGTASANFQLRITATDSEGNATSVTPTFAYDYVNQPPVVSNVDAAYTLTQGQDTVITAAATDPEGDAITWSFEEVTSGSYTFVQQPYWTNSGGSNIGRVVVYETSDLNTPVAYLSNPYAGVQDADGANVSVYNGKIYVSAYGVSVGGTDNIGAVGVYDAETFEFLHNITPPDAPGNPYHYFSIDCAPVVHEGKIYIGARGWKNNKGAVYVFDETTYDHVLFIEADQYSMGSFGGIIKIHNDILYVSQYAANVSGSRTGRILGYNISSFVFNNDPFANANKLEDQDADFIISASTTQTNQYFGRNFDINDNYLVVGSAWYNEGAASTTGTIWVFDVNNSYNELTRFTPSDAIQNSMYGYITLLTDDDLLFVSQVGDNDGKFIKYDLSGGISGLTTSAETVELGTNYGYYMSLVGDRLYVGAQASADDKLYVYNTNDLSLVHTFDLESNPYASGGTASIGPSSLNGVTITQSDNVFTVTPGTADANFQLRITATDSEGNATSVTPTFAYDFVNQPPVISNVDAAYTLTQGQDTVITAAAVDPEGDAITWSFEEVMSGSSYVVVGAYYDDDNGSNSGSVYVYNANDLSASPTKLTAFDGATGDRFGENIATAADKIVVGAFGDNSFTGSVYVYDTNDLSATPTKLTAFDAVAEDYFGNSVAATADKIIVGAFYDDENATNSGSVYVYDANDLSAQPTKLTAFDGAAGDQFGKSVAATADKIIVGAYLDDDNGSDSGSVYVYDANDLSAQPTKLTAFDGAASDRFGISVAVAADKIIVGAYLDDDNGSDSGSVYVFDANDLSAQPTKLTAFDGAAGDKFGENIATAADKIIVSAPRDDDNGNDSGSVYVYNANDLSATPTKLTAFDGAMNDQFGYSVAVTADKIVVGARLNDDNGTNSGSVYVYDANDLSAQPTKLTAFDGAASDFFGGSVSANVAPSALNGVTVTQSDNVFTVTPGTASADFQLRITATDSEGNATSVTSDFDFTYVNQAPSVAGIDAAYTLTQGQDTVITATGVDPEGDAITWSFEEVMSGSRYIAVTADADDDVASNSGSVYVYDSSDLSAQPIKLSNPEPEAHDRFGYSVSISQNKLVVGAAHDDNPEVNSGSVYVYDLTDLSAAPIKLEEGGADDRFGNSVATNSNYIFITSPNDDDAADEAGAIYVYDINDLTATPTKLTPDNSVYGGVGVDGYVASIDADDNYMVVGAYDDNSFDGAAYVYDVSNLSATPTKLTQSGSSFMGSTVRVFDDVIIVGSQRANSNAGKVYVYDANNLGAAPTVLEANDGISGMRMFGNAIEVNSDYIFVGANAGPGEAFYRFDRSDLSAAPVKVNKEIGDINDGPQRGLGASIRLIDNSLFVGALDSNTVFVYDATDLSVSPTTIIPSDAAAGDKFGNQIAISSLPSGLNGVTVTQSDNVFTVTPGTASADFQLRITATDSEGNATSVTSDFTLDYVNQAPVVMGIESAYTLTQGQNTQIVGLATDAEGEDITWSFEEVLGGSSGYVVVAAIGDDGYDGSVYIYNSSDLSATPTKLDTPAGATNFFGRDFEIIGDNLIVTADSDDTLGNDAGAAFVYDMTDLSISPTKITAPDGASGNKFGYSVTSSSDKVIISSRMVGKVYVYDANDLTATPTILTGETNDFGNKVTSNSNYIFVSDPYIHHGGNRTGSVYVYDIDSLSLVTEIEHQASYATYFGTALSANEEKLAVGGWLAGLVYVYDLNNLSSTPETTIYGYAPHRFGISVGLSDNKLVVGASDQSKAYVYDLANLPEYANYQDDLNPSSSFYLGRLDPTNEPTSDDKFGYSVSVNNDNIVVAAYGDNNNTGSTYVYDANDLSATPTILTAFDGEEGEYYGSEVVKIFDISPTSALNDTTVAQSDNVFTVTPGMQDADFQLIFKATDTSGNVTSVTSDFDFTYVNQAPVVAGIESSYLLSAGGDAEVITAAGSDVEGDAITWSFEEVMSGSNYVIVGAQRDDDNGNDSGSVYVYDANDLSAQPTKLTAFDGAATDYFGKSVAGGSGKIVVGATGDDDNGSWSGSVYVFDANDLSAQPTKLTAFDAAADDNFGNSVAVAADKIVVGALGENSLFGAVYVYDANDLSAQPTKLTAYDGAAIDTFGYTVAATADKIVVASRLDDDNGSNSGSVYVYDASDLSAQPIKLTAYDGAANDFFGHSVATTADKIIVGAEGDDDNGSDSGSVYVYDANDLSAQPTKLTAFDGAADDYFGSSVATTSDKIIVGAYADDDNGSTSGSVYVYDANDLSAQPTKLTAFDGAADDYFGVSVAATADKVFVGAYLDDDNVSNSGSVYVYDANDLSATPTKLTAFDGAEGDNFGGNLTAISSITSALNDTTVAQSDNVFTVTPGSEATSFSMRFTATDANGNATTTTSAFTVQESVMPDHPALAGRTIVVGAPYDNELRDNGTVTKHSPGAIYIYKDNTMTKVMPSSINDSGSHIKFGGVHNGTPVSTITSSKIYTGSEQFVYSYDLDGSSEFHFNMMDASLYSNSVRSKFNVWDDYFGSRAIAANDSYVAISAVGANNGSGSIAIFDPQGNFLYDIDGSQNNDNNFGDKMVMLPNNRLVVGQRTRDYGGSNRGAMYLYSLGASSASLVKNVYGSTNDQQLGSNLETNGSLVVAGLHFSNGPTTGNQYEGYVSVYDSNLNHQFNIEAPAEVSASYLNFGKATAIGSDKIAVSSGDYLINKVWFYDLSGNPIGEIEGPSNSSFAGAGSSRSIKIFGSGSSQLILITATGGDEESANMGDIWIYDQNLNLIGRLSGYDSNGTGTTIDII